MKGKTPSKPTAKTMAAAASAIQGRTREDRVTGRISAPVLVAVVVMTISLSEC
jgi:hypothetical protein